MDLIRNKCGYTNSYSKCNVYLRNNIEMLLIPEIKKYAINARLDWTEQGTSDNM